MPRSRSSKEQKRFRSKDESVPMAHLLPLPPGEGWGEGKNRRGKQVKSLNLMTLG